MKESVLDVLMYLFEHYVDEDADLEADRDSLHQELLQAGFPEAEVGKAFAWLEELTEAERGVARPVGAGPAAIRVYTDDEQERLDIECRSLLLYLEQAGILDGPARELVIDRVLALGTDDIDIEQLKWVVLMVLFNQPGHEDVIPWMEEFVFERASGQLH
jgi:Smg protein